MVEEERKIGRRGRTAKYATDTTSFHILYIHREWSRVYLNRLRLHPYCVINIPRDTLHHFIHANLEKIPAPRGESAKEVLFHLQYLSEHKAISLKDPIEKRIVLLISLFNYMEPATTEALKKQLALVRSFKASK